MRDDEPKAPAPQAPDDGARAADVPGTAGAGAKVPAPQAPDEP